MYVVECTYTQYVNNNKNVILLDVPALNVCDHRMYDHDVSSYGCYHAMEDGWIQIKDHDISMEGSHLISCTSYSKSSNAIASTTSINNDASLAHTNRFSARISSNNTTATTTATATTRSTYTDRKQHNTIQSVRVPFIFPNPRSRSWCRIASNFRSDGDICT